VSTNPLDQSLQDEASSGSIEPAPRSDKANLLDFDRAGMRAFFETIDEKPFRADQVLKWLYHHGVSDIDQMTNLSIALREKLKNQKRFSYLKKIAALYVCLRK